MLVWFNYDNHSLYNVPLVKGITHPAAYTCDSSPSSLCPRTSTYWMTPADPLHWTHVSWRESVATWIMDPAQSEMNILSNGKHHDLGDDVGVPMKMLPEEDQWVLPVVHKHMDGMLTEHVTSILTHSSHTLSICIRSTDWTNIKHVYMNICVLKLQTWEMVSLWYS